MATQTLIFVLLPNGLTHNKTLSLSIYLTPRLDQGATLAAFPDILNWPALIQQHGLEFRIGCGSKSANVAANRAILRPDVWKQIFTSKTFVEAYQNPDFQNRLIVSYPVRNAASYLKYAYQAAGSLSVGIGGKREFPLLLTSLGFRDGHTSSLDSELSQMRVQMWNEQHATAAGGIAVLTTTAGAKLPVPPDGVPAPLTEPANTHDTMTRFALFHHMPPAPNRPDLPKTEADFAHVLDFHKALTALNSYPSLLRKLGLVFDVEVPASLCPNSPSGGNYGTIFLRKVTPGFKFQVAPRYSFPSTAYSRDAASFRTPPASAPGATGILAGDIVDGLLALTPDDFHLVQMDLDGALLNALTLADNLSNRENFTTPVEIEEVLPALRSSGISLVANGRGLQLLESIADNQSFDQALTTNQPYPRPFNARDLVRGYRLDIWSSHTQKWNSLHRRNSTYKFGAKANIPIQVNDEEGFLQPAAAQPADDPTRPPDPVATANGIPQPGTDLYLHERVARWDGWSLSAPRPGKAINRNVDPGKALDDDPTVGQPLTPFKMTASFAVVPGSLPELRFGTRYRVRARAVDLAGNSIALGSTPPLTLIAPPNGVEFPYMRFEPVGTPLAVPLQLPQSGGSLERLVIRSFNSSEALDTSVTAANDQRHIAPPRVAERQAERHGMFDNAQGKLRGDKITYDLIVARDKFEFPTQGTPPMPVVSSGSLAVNYLPDPIARGAALRNLPNTPDDTNGRIANDALAYQKLPDVQPRPGSVTFIDFGTQWPDRAAFRMVLVEGTGAPKWNHANRVLTVSLPKSGISEVELSSYLSTHDLEIMGVWGWIREYFEAATLAAAENPAAFVELTQQSDLLALTTRLVLEGGHEMITPSRTLTLVHAVQQPLGRPEFVQLPVVHQPSSPIFASALRNSFTPITAWRSVGSHVAVLLGGLKIHGQSTSKIDLQARTLEVNDDLSKPAPTRTWASDHVETIPINSLDPGPIVADITNNRTVAVYIPQVDTLWFAAPIDELEGVTTPSDVAAPQHHFPDSKHRWVNYQPIATSSFQEYFSDKTLKFTREGDYLMVDVPSSARPTAPDIAYVVPTFGWERQETSNVKSNIRFGNGLRVYLHRPWYSSGDNELLGVVLWPGGVTAPDYLTREKFKHVLTQWGNDPIWKTGALSVIPGIGEFANAAVTAQGLSIEESPQAFDVAGHNVEFDQARGLWYCDIQFNNFSSYAPFVRLALARYQPHSIQGVELSRVVLADYAQLTPNRSAVISIDPGDPRRARVTIGGLGPQAPNKNAITVTVERRMAKVATDLGWEPAPASVVKVTEDAPAPAEPNAALWSGTIEFQKAPPRGQFRVVVREFEIIAIDPPPVIAIINGSRLVYAAIVGYDFP